MSDDTPATDDTDRSTDISQPLDRLSPDETLKKNSDYLRGTITEGLRDPLTGAIPGDDGKLIKFHGTYQQDDRDLRDERRRQKLEPAYQFMIRVRLPGGVCTPDQWLKLDDLATRYGNETMRLTTRQTFQFHGILKRHLKASMQQINAALLDTIAACGDDSRGVMCAVNPHLSAVHGAVYDLAKETSDHLIPRMRAYHEIWLDDERVATSGEEEPLYGPTYLPRKFKVGFAIPPVNDIDVYTQDLGFIAVIEDGALAGFNVSVGGGMGRTDGDANTYPRLGDVIGFIPAEDVVRTAEAVVGIQRDFGNRVERSRARFKYTIDSKGTAWFQEELAARTGQKLAPPRPVHFESNGDSYGWAEGADGNWHFTMFIENGRVADWEDYTLRTALRDIAGLNTGEFRLTPNQNLMIADIPADRKSEVAALLDRSGIAASVERSVLRRNAMACVALPTCALAMAESERYLPALLGKLEDILARHGLAEEPIITRMSGCNNGCSRPYVAEIGFSGRAPGKYNLYLGGGFHGERLARLYLENIGEAEILKTLDALLADFAHNREAGEHFGDFLVRAGHVSPVESGRDFNRPNAPTAKETPAPL